ncbi:hypothetical protein CTEN210_16582 [Chaetoceros tenuissimus]|uniref:Uncharacterized protein n=1 Tax=Chaetoceros tenuissimus TaxID=426638 RepID=A0AAD3HE89_9STRA|nr:hypothetical protein CTEN210_16582 [Chaetoceros tenuissimus]
MFTRLAEKLGILDIVAPRGEDSSTTNETSSPKNRKRRKMTRSERQQEQEKKDAEMAKELQSQFDRMNRMLEAQKEEEERAAKYGKFAKKQRVSYHHRANDTYYDAVIVGVHLDDGPDKPYYTIKYKRPNTYENDDGQEITEEIEIEKQTTPDRLKAVPFDYDKTWKIIGN